MQAIMASKHGVHVKEVPTPSAGPGEILVKVQTAALNRADLRVLTLEAEETPGLEWSGVVAEVGEGVGAFKVGDRVMASGKQGFAQYALAEVGRTVKVPSSLDDRQAGALMLALHTAHDALVTHGGAKASDVVLIHGAASGVALMVARIARRLGITQVIGTSRDPARRERLQQEGFDLVLDSTNDAWVDRVINATEGRGADVIIDFVSGPRFNDLIRAAAVLARIVNVGRLGGATGAFDFETHALKRIHYTGVTFRTRNREEVARINDAMLQDLGDALEQGQLCLPLDQEFTFHQAGTAFERMAANQHFGKITLRFDG